jgi:succinyl-CoA synthetase beta subunit
MEILQIHGVPTPPGFVAETADEAEDIFTNKLNKRE